MTHSLKRTIYVLALAACAAAVLAWPIVLAQSVMPAPKFTAYDSNGDPCNGCLLYAYAAGTTTPQDTFTDYALGTPNANPVVLDSAGRATVFVDQALSYKFTLKTSAGVDIWTVDNIVGQLSGVITVSAANTRGVQITRTGAESGLSIASSGGSGKTWGIASTTSGELKIQDDADGTPRIELGSGDAIDLVTTGTTAISGAATVGGTFGVTGATTLSSTLGVTGATTLSSTLAATGVVTASAAAGRAIQISRSGSNAAGLTIANADRNYGIAIDSGSSSELRLQEDSDGSPRIAVDAANNTVELVATAGVSNSNYYNSATEQPGFLVYAATATDAGLTGPTRTVGFDTEVYDTGSDFDGTTFYQFTAPVTGYYTLCTTMRVNGSSATVDVLIQTSNRNYRIGEVPTGAGVVSGCVIADMDANDSAYVSLSFASGTVTVYGGSSPLTSYFSGRLMP